MRSRATASEVRTVLPANSITSRSTMASAVTQELTFAWLSLEPIGSLPNWL